MHLDLIDSRNNVRDFRQFFQLINVKIADSDRTGFTRCVEFFHLSPGLKITAGYRPVDQIQINVVQLKAFEASVKSTFDISDTLRVIPDFGGDKKFLPGDGSLFERTAHTVFIL